MNPLKWRKIAPGSRFVHERHRARVGNVRLVVTAYSHYSAEWVVVLGSHRVSGVSICGVSGAKAAARRAVLSVIRAAESIRAADAPEVVPRLSTSPGLDPRIHHVRHHRKVHGSGLAEALLAVNAGHRAPEGWEP